MACGGCAAARKAREEAAKAAGTNRSAPVRQTASSTQANQLSARTPVGRTQTFALDLPTGKSLGFGSKLEAEAENVRRGYVGQVRKI